jgi:DNA-binding protein Fis
MAVNDLVNMGNNYNNYSASLLVSAMLRYPEIGTMSCLQESQALVLKFIVSDYHNFKVLHEKLKQALDIYHKIEGREMNLFEIVLQESEPGILTIKRDIASMSQTEMNLLVEMIKMECGNSLIKEDAHLQEDDLFFQDEIINHMLAVLRSSGTEKSITAVREEGKVLVFNG